MERIIVPESVNASLAVKAVTTVGGGIAERNLLLSLCDYRSDEIIRRWGVGQLWFTAMVMREFVSKDSRDWQSAVLIAREFCGAAAEAATNVFASIGLEDNVSVPIYQLGLLDGRYVVFTGHTHMMDLRDGTVTNIKDKSESYRQLFLNFTTFLCRTATKLLAILEDQSHADSIEKVETRGATP